ncbi:MAG: cation diffusion facilitator family transporter [Heliobacteriaceae bacterium]|nr:cation diffusion facilitator family transporter [Heliobacteriaceae bacterium]MDD4588519.1 cation diffusion facilitator family transporter [Heliobacteriaceae bacterium]
MVGPAFMLVKKANFTALKSALGNFFLALIKYIAFNSTGSPAMKAEALHSFNDGCAQAAVFLGSVIAGKKPTPSFPNGFGRVSNIIVLFVAIFMAYNSIHAVETGYQAILHPLHPVGFGWNIAVLGISLLVDGYVLFQAMKDIAREAESEAKGIGLFRLSLQKYHLASPETRLVFFEDVAATSAILIAVAGISLANFGIALWADGLAGLIIGILLLIIAVKVAWENIKGLIGYTAPEEVVSEIAKTIINVDGVEDLYELDVVREGAYLDVDGTIELSNKMLVADAEVIKHEIKRRLKKAYPNIHNIALSIHQDDDLSRYKSRELMRLRRKK